MISSTQHLQAERQTVLRFLENIPKENVIDRESWLSRLDVIEERIQKAGEKVVPARAAITYKGNPVVGSQGIASSFGLLATRAYTNAVQQFAAAWNRIEPLGERGNVPGAKNLDLLITNVARGSFGFELEAPSEEQLTIEERSLVSNGLLQTQELLRGSIGSDDELTEAVNGVDPRAINALRAFLRILAKNQATCTIETNDSRFHFDEVGQVTRSMNRLESKNIAREEVTLEGEFEGLLPTPRTFEFKVAQSGEVVVGKINPAVADIADINRKLNVPARVRAISHRVGNGRPRYVLIQQPEWLSKTEPS